MGAAHWLRGGKCPKNELGDIGSYESVLTVLNFLVTDRTESPREASKPL